MSKKYRIPTLAGAIFLAFAILVVAGTWSTIIFPDWAPPGINNLKMVSDNENYWDIHVARGLQGDQGTSWWYQEAWRLSPFGSGYTPLVCEDCKFSSAQWDWQALGYTYDPPLGRHVVTLAESATHGPVWDFDQAGYAWNHVLSDPDWEYEKFLTGSGNLVLYPSPDQAYDCAAMYVDIYCSGGNSWSGWKTWGHNETTEYVIIDDNDPDVFAKIKHWVANEGLVLNYDLASGTFCIVDLQFGDWVDYKGNGGGGSCSDQPTAAKPTPTPTRGIPTPGSSPTQ